MASIPSGVGVWYKGTHASIPAGWARQTNMDDRFAKGQSGTTDPNGTGGSATHDHNANSHSHTVASHTHTGTTAGPSSTVYIAGNNYHDAASANHTHSFTSGAATGNLGSASAAYNASNGKPPARTLIYIESDGTGDGFPADAVVYYNSATEPDDWTQYTNGNGKFTVGAATGANGDGDGGGGSHTHTGDAHSSHSVAAHDHASAASSTASANSRMYSGSSYNPQASDNGTHNVDLDNDADTTTVSSANMGTTGAYSSEPVFYKLNQIYADSNNWLEGAICMWLGTLGNIPTGDGWVHMNTASGSGVTATIDLRGKFIKTTDSTQSDLGGTGGADSHNHNAPSAHSHTVTHRHNYPTTSAAGTTYPGHSWYANAAAPSHTHAAGEASEQAPSSSSDSTGIGTSNGTTDPYFRTVAYIRCPEEPAESGSPIFFGTHI